MIGHTPLLQTDMLEQVKNIVTMIAAFRRGLNQWITGGPPSIPRLPLTIQYTPHDEGSPIGHGHTLYAPPDPSVVTPTTYDSMDDGRHLGR